MIWSVLSSSLETGQLNLNTYEERLAGLALRTQFNLWLHKAVFIHSGLE